MFEKLLAWIAGPPQTLGRPAFLGPERPPVDIEKLAEKFAGNLPHCTAKVMIASPLYPDNEFFKCDVIADSAALRHWVEEYVRLGVVTSEEKQAVLRVLPVWLMNADLSDPSPCFITPPFRTAFFNRGFLGLSGYALEFITKKIAQVHCAECDQLISDVTTQPRKGRTCDGFDWMTVEWHCAAGHLLYRKENAFTVNTSVLEAPGV